MKIVELSSYSNLDFIVNICINPKYCQDLKSNLVQGGMILGNLCFVKLEAIFNIIKLIFII